MNKRPLLSPAAWLFLLTFGLRLYGLVRLSSTPFFLPTGGDMRFYNDWALRVAHGALTDHQAFYGLPGYAYWLAFLHKLLNFDIFTVSIVTGIFQAMLEGLTTVLIWKLGIHLFSEGEDQTPTRRGQFVGAAAAVGWAFYQPAQTFSAILMPTSFAVAAYWFCIWEAARERSAPPSVWRPWLPLGLLIGFQAMLVATILFAVPLTLAAIVLRFRQAAGSGARWARAGLAALLLVAGVIAGASPCWLHNYFIAHEPVMLSAHSGLNFYIGNNPIATGYPRLPPGMSASQKNMLADSITLGETAVGHPLKHYEVSRYWSAKAHDYIASHPAEWLRLLGRKFVNFWNAYQYDDLGLISLYQQNGILPPGLRFGMVSLLGLPGLVLALFRCRRAGWVVAGVLLHLAALMPVFITERYRLAAVPGLLLLGAWGLWELWACLARAAWLPALAYAGAGALAAVFVATAPADISLWSLDYYNTGIKAIDIGNYPEARHDLETAYRYVPENSEINFALGLLWQKQQDATRAELFYRRALSINPRHCSALNNLGVLASEQKNWSVAQQCFQRSIALQPADAKTYFLQARALANLGQWDRAQASVATALRLQPARAEFQALAMQITSRSLGAE